MTRSSIGKFQEKAAGFDHPTQLPRNEDERRDWQAANRAWWESAPMRYDWRERIAETPGSEAYFKEIDRRFLTSARAFVPWRKIPFDTVIPFDDLQNKDVLEIGVGSGTQAQLLAQHCKSFTGIDLTKAASAMTSKRFALFNIPGTVLQMDAERMGFAEGSFDYVWSWGVVHVSADTQRVLREIYRVLRPGGAFTAMVYYRSWWNYYACGLLRRALLGQWRERRSLHHVSQGATDGAFARYYKPHEWRAATQDLFTMDLIRIYGLKSDVVPLPHGRLKQRVMDLLPDAFARFLTRRLRMGSLLVAHMRKLGPP
jgi:SAM-dependent methyltransferase